MKNVHIFIIWLFIIVAALFLSFHAKAPNSGIEGTVSYGPVMPVCIAGAECSRPFAGNIVIKTQDKLFDVASVQTNSNGFFHVVVPPGRYFVYVDANFMRQCGEYVDVERSFVNVTISCDTGIR